ncbi:hypothetical protein ACFODL_08920 [Phenylobacterium terrae]|uniref:Uncharacterized protein n=1 Tax=Phenylobacterium terrae TaxID=2665495 RepID=A0ABW4N6M0_9CAUL
MPDDQFTAHGGIAAAMSFAAELALTLVEKGLLTDAELRQVIQKANSGGDPQKTAALRVLFPNAGL